MTAEARLAADATGIWRAGVRAVQAPALLDGVDLAALAGRPLRSFRRIVVVGAGKASVPLAGALEAHLGALAHRVEGAVVVPEGYPATVPEGLPRPSRVAVREGGHPVPNGGSAAAAREALARARNAGPGDLVVALVSGGGSALWALPPPGVALADVQATTRRLLASGAEIGAVNTVRRRLSQTAGGRLAAAAAPARTVALVLSDVVGDDLAAIASGPTVPDPTTAADALRVVEAAGGVPESVVAFLRGGAGRPLAAPEAARAETVLLGSNATALGAARREAERLGYAVVDVEAGVTGEARAVGAGFARRALAETPRQPVAALWGGETTVTVTGVGRGGRNQEVALAAALALDGAAAPVVVLSGGTDGVDGPTDAAGGVVSPLSAARARAAGLDPAALLADNDAHAALDAAGALLRTGPTHTNVADLGLWLRRPAGL